MDSKMKMVKGKDGKMVPSFAADGKGKMAGGGMTVKMKASGGMASAQQGAAQAGMASAQRGAAQADMMARSQQGSSNPYMSSSNSRGGGAAKGTSVAAMKKGGGVHKMPDGKMMKNSAMKTMKKARG